ncbi:hypothetical protein LY78DRAFT_328009 [Colletotrichum sublineola]|nr:hypothetical protein LY78DRAFT_328009 [Colletotrichum sublineola]
MGRLMWWYGATRPLLLLGGRRGSNGGGIQTDIAFCNSMGDGIDAGNCLRYAMHCQRGGHTVRERRQMHIFVVPDVIVRKEGGFNCNISSVEAVS